MLDELIRKLLAKDPAKRFESANRTQEVMTQYLAHLQSPKTHRKPKLKLSETPRKSTILLALALMLPLSIIAGYWLYPHGGELKQPARSSFRSSTVQPRVTPSVEPAPWVLESSSNDLWQREINSVSKQMDEVEWQQSSPNRSQQSDPFEIEKTELLQQIISLERQLRPNH